MRVVRGTWAGAVTGAVLIALFFGLVIWSAYTNRDFPRWFLPLLYLLITVVLCVIWYFEALRD